jgi:hypothetical protein
LADLDRLVGYAGIGLGVAGIGLGAAFSARPTLLPERSVPLILYPSLVLFGVALIALCFVGWQYTKGRVLTGPFGGQLQRFTFGDYELRWADSLSDIHNVARMMTRLMPDGAPREDLLIALHQHNDRCIRIVEGRRGTATALAAAVIVAPLTRTGVAAIEGKSFRTVADIDLAKHVAKRWRAPAAVYIGAIAGTDRTSRVWALTALEVLLADAGGAVFYTRPVTADGRRVAKKGGFEELGAPSEIWRRG